MKKIIFLLSLISLSSFAIEMQASKKQVQFSCNEGTLIVKSEIFNSALKNNSGEKAIEFYLSPSAIVCVALVEKLNTESIFSFSYKVTVSRTYTPVPGKYSDCNYEQNGDKICTEDVYSFDVEALYVTFKNLSGRYYGEVPGSRTVTKDITVNGSCPAYKPDCDL